MARRIDPLAGGIMAAMDLGPQPPARQLRLFAVEEQHGRVSALGPTTIRRQNPRRQGDVGVGAAIAWFMERGYRVAVPLGESQPWDLAVEHPEVSGIQRVQVKTTTHRNRRGVFAVRLATSGGNRTWQGVARRFDLTSVELLFVLTDDGARYVIPTHGLQAEVELTLSDRFTQHRY